MLLKPQADSLLFAAVLLLLQPIQIEEVDPVFQIGGLSLKLKLFFSQGSIAFHIDNGPLLSSLPHLVDYYAQHADGLECRLQTAIMPDGALKTVHVQKDMADYENSTLIYGVHGKKCFD